MNTGNDHTQRIERSDHSYGHLSAVVLEPPHTYEPVSNKFFSHHDDGHGDAPYKEGDGESMPHGNEDERDGQGHNRDN